MKSKFSLNKFKLLKNNDDANKQRNTGCSGTSSFKYIYIYICTHICLSISVYTHTGIMYDCIKLLMSMNVCVS